LELGILRFINENLHSSRFFNEFFKAVTYFGEHGVFAVGVCLALTALKKPRKKGIYVLSALATEAIMANLILKPAFSRIRPFVLEDSIFDFLLSINAPVPNDASFPSGHTGIMFAFAFALYFAYGKKAAPVFILSSAVALSRLYLCVHYPTDVLGGICVGYLSAALTFRLPFFKELNKRRRTYSLLPPYFQQK